MQTAQRLFAGGWRPLGKKKVRRVFLRNFFLHMDLFLLKKVHVKKFKCNYKTHKSRQDNTRLANSSIPILQGRRRRKSLISVRSQGHTNDTKDLRKCDFETESPNIHVSLQSAECGSLNGFSREFFSTSCSSSSPV